MNTNTKTDKPKIYFTKTRRIYRAFFYTSCILITATTIFFAGMLYGKNNIEPIVISELVAKHTSSVERIYMPPTQEEVVNEIIDKAREYKVSVATALQIAECESGYNAFAVGKNKDGSNDKGVYQINSVHKVTDEERLDYRKNIEWAMKEISKNGTVAWYSSAKCWK